MLNVDNTKWEQELDEFGVEGIPHFSFLDNNGNEEGNIVGRLPRQYLLRMWMPLLAVKHLYLMLVLLGSIQVLDPGRYIKWQIQEVMVKDLKLWMRNTAKCRSALSGLRTLCEVSHNLRGSVCTILVNNGFGIPSRHFPMIQQPLWQVYNITIPICIDRR